MQYLNDILNRINTTVAGLFPCDRKNILGLAQAVRVEVVNKKPKIVPGVYAGAGDVTYAGFEDLWTLSAYHKVQNITARRVAGGFGDDAGRVLVTHNLALVICANVDQLQKTAEQIANDLLFGFPDNLKPGEFPTRDFHSVLFNVTTISLNAEQIFREEYQNADYFLGPEHALMKCQYSVESVINKKCFQSCQP